MNESPEELLDRLDPEQREVATRLRGPLCVRAGAGTGKTRAITYRIAYGVRTGAYDPHSVMALTFTSRAAGELRGRLRDLQARGVAAHTFHAAALRQLSYFWPTAVGGKIPPIAEHKLSMVAQAAGQLGLRNDAVSIRDFASEIEWSRVSLLSAPFRRRYRRLSPTCAQYAAFSLYCKATTVVPMPFRASLAAAAQRIFLFAACTA